MGVIDANGVYKYSDDDTVSTWSAFMNLGMNSVSNALTELRANSVYKAANLSGANAVRDRLVANGVVPSTTNPILVYTANDGKILAWDGTTWKRDGTSLSAVTSTPAAAAAEGSKNVGNNYLCGTKGTDAQFQMEMGSAVIRVPSDQTTQRTGYVPLINQYIGIATALFTNGDPHATGDHVIGAAAYGFRKNASGLYVDLPFKGHGLKAGNLVRVNYIVAGWVK